MVVGSQGANNDNGAAYVFTGSGSSWTYATTLSPAGVTLNDCLSTSNVCEEFGASVAITSGTIVVGAFGAGANDGAAFVYAGSGSSWTQQAVISDPGQTANDDFGIAVAISSSSTIMVGAFGENSYDGAVYVYNKGGSGWPTSPSDTLTAPGPEGRAWLWRVVRLIPGRQLDDNGHRCAGRSGCYIPRSRQLQCNRERGVCHWSCLCVQGGPR